MTPTLLDFSRRPDLALHAQIVADVTRIAKPLGVELLIVGAFARDLHLLHAHGVDTLRQTEDLDLALAVPDWAAFTALQSQLIADGTFSASPTAAHRFRHRSDLPIDLVPFGDVETGERRIAWPPRGETVMDVFGFREAAAAAREIVLPEGVRCRMVSLAALALLKLVCWHDRHYASPRKDAHDLRLILDNYLRCGNEERLFGEFVAWTEEEGFDYERAGARMVGHDIALLLDDQGRERVATLLAEQADAQVPGRLPAEMLPRDPDRARDRLEDVLGGLLEV